MHNFKSTPDSLKQIFKAFGRKPLLGAPDEVLNFGQNFTRSVNPEPAICNGHLPYPRERRWRVGVGARWNKRLGEGSVRRFEWSPGTGGAGSMFNIFFRSVIGSLH